MRETKCAKRLPGACVHFVTARASLFTDHKISGQPVRAKFIYISEQFVSKLWTSLPQIYLFVIELMVETLCCDLV